MVGIHKRKFYYSAIALGITCFSHNVYAAENLKDQSDPTSQNVKSQSFRDKPEEEMSWIEWLASGFKPAYTLEEAVRDPKFYEASAWDDLTHQMEKIGKKLGTNSLTRDVLREKLTESYGLVKAGLVSPQEYFKLLSELPRTQVCTKTFLKKTREAFRKDLKTEPELLKQYLASEMAEFLKGDFTSPDWTQNVADTLHFYGQLETSLDHLTVINHIAGYVKQRIEAAIQDSEHSDNKELKDTLLNQLNALNKALGISMNRLTTEDPDYMLKAGEAMLKAREVALKEAEDHNKAHSSSVLLEDLEDMSEKPSSSNDFKSFVYEGGKLVYKVMDFAVKNPGQAITMLLAAQVAAAAAYNSVAPFTPFTWGNGTTGYSPSVASFNNPQNIFAVTDQNSPSSGVEVYPFYSNGTSYGPSSLVNATGIQPISVGLSNAIGVGYYYNQNYYFNNITLNGNQLLVGSPVQINTNSGILNNLGFAPISSGSPLFPDGTLFTSWSIQVGGVPEGRAGLIFPNGTTTPETSLGCVINSIVPVAGGNIDVLCTTTSGGQPIVQVGNAVFDSLSRTFTFGNVNTILPTGTFATFPDLNAVPTSTNDILLSYITNNNGEKVSVMEFTQNATVINPAKVVYPSTSSDIQAYPNLVPVPGKGNAILWGSQNGTASNIFGSFTPDEGKSFAAPVDIASPYTGDLSAALVGNNIAVVTGGNNGLLVPVDTLDTFPAPTTSPTGAPSTSSGNSLTPPFLWFFKGVSSVVSGSIGLARLAIGR